MRPKGKTELEKLDEVDEREDMSSDDEKNLVNIDEMLLGDKATGRKYPTESFKRVQGELQHLPSLKLVEDLLIR